MTSGTGDTQWWLSVDGRAEGPFSVSELRQRLRSGSIPRNAYACPVGGTEWKCMARWPHFADFLPPDLPPAAGRLQPAPARLPPIATAICVYAVAISPLLWLIGCVPELNIVTFMFHEYSPYRRIERGILFLSNVLACGITAVTVIGGLRLRALRQSGPTLLLTAFWIAIATTVLGLAFLFAMGVLADEQDFALPDEEPEEEVAFSVVDAINIAELGFVIFALIWLHRNRRTLPLLRP